MAWYPAAKKMELQPESDAQPAIKPTQFILHSIVAPWTPERTYEYWRDSTNLESHFGLGYDGSLGQYIGTQTRADANAAANRRTDGTGAVSLESASNTAASDPWTDAQVDAIVKLGVWLHQTHAIPLRICRTWDDPGFGYHRLFKEWNPNAHSCPGDARVKQFHEVVFPGIVAAANHPQEDDPMAGITKADIYDAVWKTDQVAAPADAPDIATNSTWQPQSYLKDTNTRLRALAKKVDTLAPVVSDQQIAALASAVAANPVLAEQIAEKVAEKLAARLAQ